MARSVRLPPWGLLGVELVKSLFRLSVGDVEAVQTGTEELFVVKDAEKFGKKLKVFAQRAEEVLRATYDLVGGRFVAGECKVGKVQDLAKKAAEDPEKLLDNLGAFRVKQEGGGLVLEWGANPISDAKAPPLLASYEFMEGARTWPAPQLVVYERRGKEVVEGGFKRRVKVGCLVAGAVALGFAATYVRGSPRLGEIVLLVPLTMVEYDLANKDVRGMLLGSLGAFKCELPEHLAKALTASRLDKPAAFRLVKLAYRGGKEIKKDASYEYVIDVSPLGARQLVWGKYWEVLRDLAQEWCRCDGEGWQSEGCSEVEKLAEAVKWLYLYAESGYADKAYDAASALAHIAASNSRAATLARRLAELAEELI